MESDFLLLVAIRWLWTMCWGMAGAFIKAEVSGLRQFAGSILIQCNRLISAVRQVSAVVVAL